ncbi:hypothetical protein L6452_02979 [Arctium lappa]|uniref:Uncharacterized protein n=1 Tax=Arctium lappa TaxID=4217 RepID=A0ACB9FKZ1_ARCLA|nr:hypothetical protein L6452_02979 [Arctium lappa]
MESWIFLHAVEAAYMKVTDFAQPNVSFDFDSPIKPNSTTPQPVVLNFEPSSVHSGMVDLEQPDLNELIPQTIENTCEDVPENAHTNVGSSDSAQAEQHVD